MNINPIPNYVYITFFPNEINFINCSCRKFSKPMQDDAYTFVYDYIVESVYIFLYTEHFIYHHIVV